MAASAALAAELAAALAAMPHLTLLSLRGHALHAPATTLVAPAIAELRHLRHLRFDGGAVHRRCGPVPEDFSPAVVLLRSLAQARLFGDVTAL
jgi:hypothetical protein